MAIPNPTISTYTYKGVWGGTNTMYDQGDIVSPDTTSITAGYYINTDFLLCISPVNSTGINIHPAGHAQEGSSVQKWRKITFAGEYTGGQIGAINQYYSYFGETYLCYNISNGVVSPTTTDPWRQVIGYSPPTYIPAGVSCFLKDAPVLTPSGYRRIDSLAVGDLVQTASGPVAIQAVKIRAINPSPKVNPYVIPKGHLGATQDLAISPDHKVQVGAKMIEARLLGLKRREMKSDFEYYNLELPNYENMTVAGVTVESQFPIRRVIVTMAEFRQMLIAKYGELTPAILARVQKKVRMLTEGRVEVPIAKV